MMPSSSPPTAPAPPSFGDLLRRYRRATGISQETLAERAGISARAVSDLERGLYRAPHRDTVQLLSQALGLTAEEQAALEGAIVRTRGPRAASPADAPATHPSQADGPAASA